MSVTAVFQTSLARRAFALEFLAEETGRLGVRALVLTDPDLDPVLASLVESEMRESGPVIRRRRRIPVEDETERLVLAARAVGAEVIVGVGTGDTLDIVIAAADRSGLSALLAPLALSIPCIEED